MKRSCRWRAGSNGNRSESRLWDRRTRQPQKTPPKKTVACSATQRTRQARPSPALFIVREAAFMFFNVSRGPDEAGPSPSRSFASIRGSSTISCFLLFTSYFIIHNSSFIPPFQSAKRHPLHSCRFPSIRVHSGFHPVPRHNGHRGRCPPAPTRFAPPQSAGTADPTTRFPARFAFHGRDGARPSRLRPFAVSSSSASGHANKKNPAGNRRIPFGGWP